MWWLLLILLLIFALIWQGLVNAGWPEWVAWVVTPVIILGVPGAFVLLWAVIAASSSPAKTTPSRPRTSGRFTSDSGGEYYVAVSSFPGSDKIRVIKLIRAMTGLGLIEAKNLVDSAPCVIDGLGQLQAEQLARDLESAGAMLDVGRGGGEAEGLGAELVTAELVLEDAKPRRLPIPERVRHEVWRRDQGRCVDCGSRERLEFDHIIPFSRGGSNTARNIGLRCETCNRRKAAAI